MSDLRTLSAPYEENSPKCIKGQEETYHGGHQESYSSITGTAAAICCILHMTGLWGKEALSHKKTSSLTKSPQSMCQNVFWFDEMPNSKMFNNYIIPK